MLSINWTQHAVGHGGFHTGQMDAYGGPVFNWIFDCGSRRTRKFDDYLRAWTDLHQRPVDWLFVSHFDTDHVSGLDTLMSRTVVRDVMVPYVNERELAYSLLYEIGRGNLNRWFVELAADPAAFFLSRGATGVTFLQGRDGDRGEGGEFEPDRPDGEEKRDDGHGDDWEVTIKPTPGTLKATAPGRGAAHASASPQIIEGGECEIAVAGGRSGLLLKPYRAPIKPRLHRGLIKSLQSKIGTLPWLKSRPGLGDLAYAIAHYARTNAGRSALRQIFASHADSSNRSSLSLASMPFVACSGRGHWLIQRPFTRQWGDESEPVWLNTGDAELLKQPDLADWQAAYRADLPKVRVLALPHHGSDKNSNEDLQDLCPGALLTAHVRSGGGKHPGLGVSVAAGQRLACVTELPDSRVIMRFRGY